MAAIAGVFAPQSRAIVEKMLQKMKHRMRGEVSIQILNAASFGGTAPANFLASADSGMIEDRVSDWHYALAGLVDGRPLLERDALGIVPLYYGRREDGALCFASEVKGLLEATVDINEFPPGSRYDGEAFERYFELTGQPPLSASPERIAAQLCARLEKAVQQRINSDDMGCYLSGGLDSSVLAALVRPHVRRLRTVAAGVMGAPDLHHAREVAGFIRSDHREVIVTLADMLKVLPDVIAHLESFDALLVRSSIMHYLASQHICRYASDVFSGEGGDELFAGYAYLKDLPFERLPAELINITQRLHNTALQRVDRCAAAFGLRAHICFLDPAVVELAVQIPIELKLRDGMEKWIVREAARDLLPERVLQRTKAKFWEGAGVQDLLAQHAESTISDADFARQKILPNGWVLSGKEELMYYRIFREQLGAVTHLEWMGRSPHDVGT